jgi:ABC-type antimicrobial peptide transport system permease subunit
VAQDGKYHDLTESPHPVVYVPLSQSQQDAEILVVRSQQAPKETIAALRRMLGVIQPNVPISVRSWSDELDSEFFPARAATLALGVMGLLAVMLAVTGIFGIAAYSVSRRVKELGIRAALGARKAQIVGAAVGRPILLLAVGSALGLLSSIFATALLQRIVYQANPCDPTVIAGALLTMALLGAAATTIPVRRALAIDPSQLMREE